MLQQKRVVFRLWERTRHRLEYKHLQMNRRRARGGGGGGGGGGEREGSDKTESVRLDWRDLVSILVYLDGQDKG